jgi:hypothetical protein
VAAVAAISGMIEMSSQNVLQPMAGRDIVSVMSSININQTQLAIPIVNYHRRKNSKQI